MVFRSLRIYPFSGRQWLMCQIAVDNDRRAFSSGRSPQNNSARWSRCWGCSRCRMRYASSACALRVAGSGNGFLTYSSSNRPKNRTCKADISPYHSLAITFKQPQLYILHYNNKTSIPFHSHSYGDSIRLPNRPFSHPFLTPLIWINII